MKKIRKIAFIISIFILIHYALHILLGFNMIYSLFYHHPLFEKAYSFIAGICGFLNLLYLGDDKS